MLPFSQERFVSPFAKYVDIKIYGMIILPIVLCGCEMRSLTLKIEHGLRICENMVLKNMFGPKWGGLNCVVRSVMGYTSHQILLRWSSQ